MELTAKQAKMVLEYFAAQAAEDAPTDPLMIGRHMWLTLYTTSLAVERHINKYDWDTLVDACIDYQSFDRDPAGYLHERGEDDVYKTRTMMRWTLQDLVSWAIDNAYHNSGA